jgi:uncharacterized protein YqjF (DUF2071 family)
MSRRPQTPEIDVHPPRAVASPLMFQDWCSVTFLHWRCDAAALARRLPAGLTIDTFADVAWIGLTPFRVANLRPPFLPPLPWISSFPETNVRTYVVGPNGARGIWFFTLDAARLAAVLGARSAYGLPYRWAEMAVQSASDTVTYQSDRRMALQKACSKIVIRPGAPIKTSALEAFLTARFRLYTLLRGKLAFADVEHEPWNLQHADVLGLEETLLESCGLPERTALPLAHYCEGVHVRVGAPQFM